MVKQYLPPDTSYWLMVAIDKPSTTTLDNLLSTSKNQQREKGKEDFLETIIQEKRNFLAGAINQLGYIQQERQRISQATKEKIDYDLSYNQYLIFELAIWPRGTNSSVDKRRGGLENIRATLEQEKRKEEVSCWQDLFKVNQDVRLLLKEYMELKIKNKLLQDN